MDLDNQSSQVVLSIQFQKDRLGACIYREAEKSLEICEFWDHGPLEPPSLREVCLSSNDDDTPLSGDSFPALMSLLHQIEPTKVLAPARSDDSLITALNDYIALEKEKQVASPPTLVLLKPGLYNYNDACAMIYSLSIPEISHAEDHRQALAALFAFDEIQMIRATGALLGHLLEETQLETNDVEHAYVSRERGNAQVRLVNATSTLQVSCVLRLEMDGRLHLDSSVYDYLQIFHADRHPSVLGGAPKEGISLFSFLNRCASSLGSKLLKRWLLAPLCDPHLINERLDTIDILRTWLDAENEKKLDLHLKHVVDLRLALSRLQCGASTITDWKQLKDTCHHATLIIETLKTIQREFATVAVPANSLLQRLIESHVVILTNVTRIIADCLELDAKDDTDKPVIRGSVDSELDRLRSVLANLDDFLDKVAKVQLDKYQGIRALRVMYVPQMGFQVATPFSTAEALEALRGLFLSVSQQVDGEEAEFQFASNHYGYWKTKAMRELDEFVGDLKPMILDRSALVLRTISDNVLQYSRHLLEVTQLLAELDVMCALTKISKEARFSRPKILNPILAFTPQATDDAHAGLIQIVAGRHPLTEYIMSSQASSHGRFVPNSTEISLFSEFANATSALHVITGPNGSGKSVYMTQVGLIVFMAHIGCYVPADEAKIPCVDKIFCLADTGPVALPPVMTTTKNKTASVTYTGSGAGSFLTSAQRMGRMLREATPLSLIFVDEFGRGTTDKDALSLLMASIHKLATPRLLRTVDAEGYNVDSEGTPKCFISSHLKLPLRDLMAHFPKRLQCFHMNVLPAQTPRDPHRTPRGQESHSNTSAPPTYLYQVTPVGQDYQPLQLGLYSAKTAGIPDTILARAAEVKTAILQDAPIVPFIRTSQDANLVQEQAELDEQMEHLLEALEYHFGSESLARMETVKVEAFLALVP